MCKCWVSSKLRVRSQVTVPSRHSGIGAVAAVQAEAHGNILGNNRTVVLARLWLTQRGATHLAEETTSYMSMFERSIFNIINGCCSKTPSSWMYSYSNTIPRAIQITQISHRAIWHIWEQWCRGTIKTSVETTKSPRVNYVDTELRKYRTDLLIFQTFAVTDDVHRIWELTFFFTSQASPTPLFDLFLTGKNIWYLSLSSFGVDEE